MKLLLSKPRFAGRIDFEMKYQNIMFFSKIMVEGALPGFWEHKRKSKLRLRQVEPSWDFLDLLHSEGRGHMPLPKFKIFNEKLKFFYSSLHSLLYLQFYIN